MKYLLRIVGSVERGRVVELHVSLHIGEQNAQKPHNDRNHLERGVRPQRAWKGENRVEERKPSISAD